MTRVTFYRINWQETDVSRCASCPFGIVSSATVALYSSRHFVQKIGLATAADMATLP